MEGLPDPVAHPVPLREGVLLPLRVGVSVEEREAVAQAVAEAQEEALALWEVESVGVRVVEVEGEVEALAVRLGVEEALGQGETLGDWLRVSVPLALAVRLALLAVGAAETALLTVVDTVAQREAEAQMEAEGVAVEQEEVEGEAEILAAAPLAVAFTVPVALLEGVPVGHCVGVRDTVPLAL